jgi:dsRNA-specific ribonuclease
MTTTIEIYIGPRDDNFKKLITSILEKGKLKKKYIDILTNDTNMKLFSQAFTSPTANIDENYEMYEQLGDLSANKFIVSYVYKRFPQIQCSKGVKIAARLRINYGAKQSFYEIANNFGFWEYITASKELRDHKKKALLEDTLESFVGCTESILDNMFQIGVGYGIVYSILKGIFDEIPISLNYNDLYDAKTRLKETFDPHSTTLGKLVYLDYRQTLDGRIVVDKEEKIDTIASSEVYQVSPDKRPANVVQNQWNKPILINGIERSRDGWNLIGIGKASVKKDAEQRAAIDGLKYMNKFYPTFIKKIPEEYIMFCT